MAARSTHADHERLTTMAEDKYIGHDSEEVTKSMYKRFGRIFGNKKLSEVKTHNAYVLMMSNKNFSNHEIYEMAGFKFDEKPKSSVHPVPEAEGDVGGMPRYAESPFRKKKAQKKMSGGKVYARGSRKANYNG